MQALKLRMWDIFGRGGDELKSPSVVSSQRAVVSGQGSGSEIVKPGRRSGIERGKYGGRGQAAARLLAADVDHGPRGLEEAGFTDVVAGFFLVDGLHDVVGKFRVGLPGAHAAVEIVLDLGEEAGADFAVGSEPDATARTAECLADGGNDADFAYAVREGVAAGGFAGLPGSDRDERQLARDALSDLFESDNDLGRPEAAFLERHELDEADDDVFLTRKTCEPLNFSVVESAEKDAVDFDGSQSGGFGRTDPGEYLFKTAGHPGDAFEGRRIDGVHADGDSVEPGGFERRGHFVEQVAVGGERDIKRLAGDGAEPREFLDEFDEAVAEEGFPAG